MNDSDDKQRKHTGNIIQGISISGNSSFKAGDVTVTITLRDVSQDIASIPNSDADEKEKLKQLIAKLEEALTTVPAQLEADAKLVATRTEQLVQEAGQDAIDQEEVEHKANKLRQAAEKLRDAMPVVLEVATQIVAYVVRLSIQ